MTARAKLRKLEADNDKWQREAENMLDLLNAILFANGGKVVVSRAHLVAASRRPVQVTHGKDAIVIERVTDGESPRQDIWLPGSPN